MCAESNHTSFGYSFYNNNNNYESKIRPPTMGTRLRTIL